MSTPPSTPMQTQPSITLILPDGWFFKESLTLLAPDGQANVIASSEPLDRSITAREYAEVQGDLLESEFPGYRQFSTLEPLNLKGLSDKAFLREFSWNPRDGDTDTVRQLQIYAVRSGRGFTATATTPESRYDDFRIELMEILVSLCINEQAADAMAAVQPEAESQSQ